MMPEQTADILYSKLESLRDHLKTRGHRLVLAESCTCGLVAAELGAIPGISEFFCGSMVVYRTATKNSWLGLENRLLFDPNIGPVSFEVTKQLADHVLNRTPEATMSAAVTGHLGPNAPRELDGNVFCGVYARHSQDVMVRQFQLTSPEPQGAADHAARRIRQTEAALFLIQFLLDYFAASC